jgi:hypothetical protein
LVRQLPQPASLRWLEPQRRWREQALRRRAALVQRLHHDHPYPVLVTGDMNDHRAFTVHPGHRHGRRRRRHHHPHPVHPATPGPDRLGLRPPGVRFHRYATVTGPLARRTSDHPLIHAHGLPDHR